MDRKKIRAKMMEYLRPMVFNHLPDEVYLKLRFRKSFGRKLNLENPVGFNEKMQWLKLYYRKPEFARMVDKYEVKGYVKEIAGRDLSIPTIAVWNSVEEINPEVLPDKFVIKCTHDSHTVLICHDKKTFDFARAGKQLRKAMKKNFYYIGREWPYKHVQPRIIAEEYLENSQASGLLDYKFYMFHGAFKLLNITERVPGGETYVDYFDRNLQPVDLTWSYPHSGKVRRIPEVFSDMLETAEKLSSGFPFLRVDMYAVNGKYYVGELTFFDGDGFDRIEPESWEQVLGDWLVLPSKVVSE